MTINGPENAAHGSGQLISGCGKWLLRIFSISAWFVAFIFCGGFELLRLQASVQSPAGALGWFANWNPDSTLLFLVLLLMPFIVVICGWQQSWGIVKKRFRSQQAEPPNSSRGPKISRLLLISAGLFLLSFFCSASIGWRTITLPASAITPERSRTISFASLPPAYHDEFSYLLQANTFLAGRVAWPPAPIRPDLFHQIHVLNEPTTASRYFPWTGAWMAIFVKWNQPYIGHWTAGGMACVCFYHSLRKLLSSGWALTGGLLIAVSPGLAVFSNLLLAHHPTLLALSVFLWAFLNLMESRSAGAALTAGIALSAAMLGRPMTAAGFAFPFGAWLLVQWLRSEVRVARNGGSRNISIRLILLMGLPLIAGLAILAWLNHQITGQWNHSAYQFYTETWTPRHRFGFHNVEIGNRLAGPRVLESYDQWATNLTGAKAAENVAHRLIASTQWTLGAGSLLLLLIAAVPSIIPLRGCDLRIPLVCGSVLSLHLVHVPYWYDGILHWHYVFETAPLLLILATVGLRNMAFVLAPLRLVIVTRCWLGAIVLASLIPNWVDADSLWGPSRVSLAVSEQSYSRVRFELFRRMTHSQRVNHPCLILVDERGSDVQLSFIVNPPDLSGDVLVCRMPESTGEISELATAFPNRTLYRFEPQSFELTVLDRQNP